MQVQKQIPEFKVILIGDSGVGKTSITVRATQNTFEKDGTTNTIGFSFQKMFKEIPNLGCVNLFIWDTAGQEMYRSMIKMYYRGVSVALVVYDVSDRASFECIGDWLKDVREKQQQRVLASSDNSGKEECLYYVIGNKCDLDDEGLREVSYEEGEQWVKDYVEENCEDEDEIDIKFLEVSAKNGTNIFALFEEIAVKLLDKHHKFLMSKGIKPNQV